MEAGERLGEVGPGVARDAMFWVVLCWLAWLVFVIFDTYM